MRWIVTSLVLLAVATMARAGGINLSWDHCHGDGAVSYKSFFCDTNSGSEDIIGSFVLDAATPQAPSREEVVFDFQAQGATLLPAWWDFATLSSCRRNQMAVEGVPRPVPSACQSSTSNVVAFVRDNFRYPTPDHMQLSVTLLVSGPPLAAGTEYFCCRLILGHAASVGADACAGCTDAVAITLSQLRVLAGTDQTLSTPAGGNVIDWQVPTPTAGRRSSWGSVKALYH